MIPVPSLPGSFTFGHLVLPLLLLGPSCPDLSHLVFSLQIFHSWFILFWFFIPVPFSPGSSFLFLSLMLLHSYSFLSWSFTPVPFSPGSSLKFLSVLVRSHLAFPLLVLPILAFLSLFLHFHSFSPGFLSPGPFPRRFVSPSPFSPGYFTLSLSFLVLSPSPSSFLRPFVTYVSLIYAQYLHVGSFLFL